MAEINKAMPVYTKGEEIFNAVSHIVGGAFAIVATIIGLIVAIRSQDTYKIVSMAIYGVSMILLYAMSSIYHFLPSCKGKRVFRILDHCTIYFLIAGSYTPYCLVTLRNSGAWGWAIFGITWGFCILATTMVAVAMYHPFVKVFSVICYVIMGWTLIIALNPLIASLGSTGFILLLVGGILYTVGAVIYAVGKKVKYMHSVFHLFVLAGSALHFASILFFVLK
ncbi:MAG: hemolysin III family protein [Clostridia bacterium]